MTATKLRKTGGKKAQSGQSVCQIKCAGGAWLSLFCFFITGQKNVSVENRMPGYKIEDKNTRRRRLNGAKVFSCKFCGLRRQNEAFKAMETI